MARFGQICVIAPKLATVSFAASDDFGFINFKHWDLALNLARFKTVQILINSEFL